MSYLRGPERSQVEMFPPCLEDYVAPNSPARFIDAFVEELNFQALGFTHAQPASTGRPPYHPADLLKLYLYGYLNRIRSSRRLEAEAARNLEVIWLLRHLKPDFKTIAEFRRTNRQAFKPLFRDFNLLCRRLELFGAELVAIDGSKFKAVNNSRSNYSQEQIRQLVEKIESRIEDYLKQLETQDQEAQGVAGAPSTAALNEKIERLKATRGRYGELLGQLKEKAQNEVSLTDPDSRKMKGPHGEHFIGYNVQLAVDAKHDLIVVEEVSQCASDRGQLAAVAKEAKARLDVPTLQAVADKGYHEADQLEACEQAGIETFVPQQGTSSGQGKGGVEIFPKEKFSYEATTDTYQCPAGQKLARCSESKSRGKDTIRYANYAACRQCELKTQCTTGAHRMIGRRPNQAVLERAALRAKAQPQIIAQRKTIVEHVFGAMRNWHHDRFLMRGLEKVRAEFSLSALVYNLRRVINLVSLEELTAAAKDKMWVPARG
jgi:transposase